MKTTTLALIIVFSALFFCVASVDPLDTYNNWTAINVGITVISCYSAYDQGYCKYGDGVSIDGQHIVVGGPGKDRTYSPDGQHWQTGEYEWSTSKRYTARCNGVVGEYFGARVSVKGNFYIGSCSNCDDGVGAGVIWEYDSGSDYFSDKTHLRPCSTVRTSVAVSAEGYAVVNCYVKDNDFEKSGEVWVYQRTSQGVWGNAFRIKGQRYKHYFGRDVAIHGDHLVVGGFLYNESTDELIQPEMYVYTRNSSSSTGNEWIYSAVLNLNTHARTFNWSNSYLSHVAIDGDYIVVGLEGPNVIGSVLVFHRFGEHEWDNGTILSPPEPQVGSYFGNAVNIHRNFVIVGAYKFTGTYESQGAAYVYKRISGDGENIWDQGTVLEQPDSDREINGYFGSSVDLYRDKAVVGAEGMEMFGDPGSGNAYVFRLRECPENYFYDDDHVECTRICPPAKTGQNNHSLRQYDTRACVSCDMVINNCSLCEGNDDAVECVRCDSLFLDQIANECVETCPVGTFKHVNSTNDDLRSCVSCQYFIDGCVECVDNDENENEPICTNCSRERYFSSDTEDLPECLIDCPFDEFGYTNLSIPVNSSYHKRCVSCDTMISGCSECVDNENPSCTRCSSSSSDLFLDEYLNECTANCPDGTFQYTNFSNDDYKSCVDECPSDSQFGFTNNVSIATCVSCDSDSGVNQCIRCEGNENTTCLECATDSYLDEETNQCVSQCEDGKFGTTSTSNEEVKICVYCSSRISDCVECEFLNETSNLILCTSCGSSKFLDFDNNRCVSDCEDDGQYGFTNDADQKKICGTCDLGQNGISNCSRCSGIETPTCTTCTPPNVLYENSCSNTDTACPENVMYVDVANDTEGLFCSECSMGNLGIANCHECETNGETLECTRCDGYFDIASGCEDCTLASLCVNEGFPNANCTRCICSNNYFGNLCSNFSCSEICQNGGECVSPNQCQCSPVEIYGGESCNETCSPPCRNGGDCDGPSHCDCSDTEFFGSLCDQCSPICQHDGICLDGNQCNCSGTGYNGSNCQLPICEDGCLHEGTCSAPNKCSCPDTDEYTGTRCETAVCFGTPATNDTVCSGNGVCEGPDHCVCVVSPTNEQLYTGLACNVNLQDIYGYVTEVLGYVGVASGVVVSIVSCLVFAVLITMVCVRRYVKKRNLRMISTDVQLQDYMEREDELSMDEKKKRSNELLRLVNNVKEAFNTNDEDEIEKHGSEFIVGLVKLRKNIINHNILLINIVELIIDRRFDFLEPRVQVIIMKMLERTVGIIIVFFNDEEENKDIVKHGNALMVKLETIHSKTENNFLRIETKCCIEGLKNLNTKENDFKKIAQNVMNVKNVGFLFKNLVQEYKKMGQKWFIQLLIMRVMSYYFSEISSHDEQNEDEEEDEEREKTSKSLLTALERLLDMIPRSQNANVNHLCGILSVLHEAMNLSENNNLAQSSVFNGSIEDNDENMEQFRSLKSFAHVGVNELKKEKHALLLRTLALDIFDDALDNKRICNDVKVECKKQIIQRLVLETEEGLRRRVVGLQGSKIEVETMKQLVEDGSKCAARKMEKSYVDILLTSR